MGKRTSHPPGTFSWVDLATTDLDAARAFYADAFGWRSEDVDTGPGGPEIVSVYNGDTLNANMSRAQPGEPPHWRPYFTVESVDAAVERVGELGGAPLYGPVRVPSGGFAIARDPQGAVLALFEGEIDP